MTWPAFVFWGLIVAGMFVRGPLLLYLFFILGSFGTLAVVPSAAIGVNLVPESICAVFLVVKLLGSRKAMERAIVFAMRPARLGYLGMFLVYAGISAYFLPRLFAGTVIVTSMAPGVIGGQPLEPTTQNVTQAGYLLISCSIVFAFAVAGEKPAFRRQFLRALLIGGLAVIATGLLDMLSPMLGLSAFLDSFRTASYALLVDVELFDSKRVVGLMTEASSYGALCVRFLSALLFLRPHFEPRLRDRWVPAAIVALLVMAVLSTSSGAYVALVVLAAVYGVSLLYRRRSRSPEIRRALRVETFLLGALGIAAVCVLVIEPSLLDPAYDWFDKIVLQKTDSDSYVERSFWTKSALDAFFGTYGFGVGVGGARTSNWVVAIISNTGVVGTLLFVLFLGKIFWRSAGRGASRADMLASLRFALLPTFAIMSLVGTSTDFGVFQGALCGIAASLMFSPSTGEMLPAPGGIQFYRKRDAVPRPLSV